MSSKSPPPDDPEEEPTYEVGYGKPPQATRFQPGKSGNPKGRPKGSRKAPPADTAVEKLNALVLQEAYRTIKIKDGETLVELPVIQAAVRSVTLSAAKGNQRSQRLLFDSVGEIERERRRERLKLFEEVVAYKVEAEREMAMAAAGICRRLCWCRVATTSSSTRSPTALRMVVSIGGRITSRTLSMAVRRVSGMPMTEPLFLSLDPRAKLRPGGNKFLLGMITKRACGLPQPFQFASLARAANGARVSRDHG